MNTNLEEVVRYRRDVARNVAADARRKAAEPMTVERHLWWMAYAEIADGKADELTACLTQAGLEKRAPSWHHEAELDREVAEDRKREVAEETELERAAAWGK